MSAGNTVVDMMTALATGDADTFFSLVSDDFQFSGPMPEPMSAEQWFGTGRSMAQAFPDLDYGLQIVEEHGGHVHTITQVSGTHTGDFDLTPMGMGVVPPTGKSFQNPAEDGTAVVVDGKVVSLHVESPPNGGLAGILGQLGIAPPH